jgi:hypothetical protein
MQCPSGFKTVQEDAQTICVSQRDNSIRMPLGSPPPEPTSDSSDDLSGVAQIQSDVYPVLESFDTLQETVAVLKPLRPPTAPASDLAMARKDILETSTPNFLLIQVELAILILCLLAYSFIPLEHAPGVVVLLLSVGVAVGIFLWKQ